MKTTKSSRTGGRATKTSAPRKGESDSARKPGRIPVRGALKTSGKATGKTTGKGNTRSTGVKDRAAAASVPKSRADLNEIRAVAVAAIDAALDKKALAPVLIDVSAMASYTDFIGIVSGRSDRQVDAIAENIRMVMKQRGKMTLGQEGTGNGRWTLLDFGSVVIHVFYHPVREFYDLESLWIEAPRIPLDVPADSMVSEPESYYGGI